MSNKGNNGVPVHIPDDALTGPGVGCGFPTASVLRSAVKTFRADDSGPGPIRLGALQRLTALIGTIEGRETSKNWGPPLDRFAKRWLSAERYASYGPGGSREGDLLWCAFAVVTCFLEEMEARRHEQLASAWRQIASGSCETLHHNLSIHGWTWAPGEPLPAALQPKDPGAEGLPATGDLVFYGAAPDDLKHVDFFEGRIVGAPGSFASVGGNAGYPLSNRVARTEHTSAKSLARVMRLARVPW